MTPVRKRSQKPGAAKEPSARPASASNSKAVRRRWLLHNRERIRQQHHRYYLEHRQAKRETNRRYHLANGERIRLRKIAQYAEAPPSRTARRVRSLLNDPRKYIAQCAGIRLRPYQEAPFLRTLESIQKHHGDSIVVIFPRQSGKDELLINLKTYLLDLYSPVPAAIVEVNPTYRPQTLQAVRRFDHNIGRNLLTRGKWTSRADFMRTLGAASVTFLSGDKHASVVGATASLLLIVNEAQDIDPQVYAQKFEPMAASTNATRLFAGTAWTSRTLLAQELRLAREAERADGRRRVFVVDASEVRRYASHYGAHVDEVVRKRGRQHPLVKTQYFNEEIDAQAGMFNAARRALMQCDDAPSAPALAGPAAGHLPQMRRSKSLENTDESDRRIWGRTGGGAFCIDVGGQDEALLKLEGLGNPGRDSTTLSIVEIDLSSLPTLQAPTYRLVQRHGWQGQNHITVFGKIKALAETWRPRHIVIDATGVGEGLWAMLDKAFPTRVLPVKFTQQTKSEIGYRFLSIIETGRFRDCTEMSLRGATEGSDVAISSLRQEGGCPASLVDAQYAACLSEVLIGPQKTLRWGVPDGTRDQNGELIHDDIIMADALVSQLDLLDWSISTGTLVVAARDPLEELSRMR